MPVWAVGLMVATVIAVLAVVAGRRVDLIGLLVAGPCIAALSGRGRPTALVGAWAVTLAVGVGAFNGIWGSFEHLAFVSSVVVVSVTVTSATSVIERVTGPPTSAARHPPHC